MQDKRHAWIIRKIKNQTEAELIEFPKNQANPKHKWIKFLPFFFVALLNKDKILGQTRSKKEREKSQITSKFLPFNLPQLNKPEKKMGFSKLVNKEPKG